MKNNWKKYAIIAAVAVVLAIAAWFIFKKIKRSADDRKKQREYGNIAADIARATGKESQLTSTQTSTLAGMVNDAVKGLGTDEDKLIRAIKSIPTAADYFLVKQAYQSEFDADMWDDITDDLTTDDGDYGQIVAHLNLIGVPPTAR